MPFKLEGKEMYHIFVFAKFWSTYSKVVRLGKNAHSKQRNTISTQTLQVHVKFICLLKLRATSYVPINAKSYQFDALFWNKNFAQFTFDCYSINN